MAKTNPIGVRFDPEILKELLDRGLAKTPQEAVNFYERSYKKNRSTYDGVQMKHHIGEEVDISKYSKLPDFLKDNVHGVDPASADAKIISTPVEHILSDEELITQYKKELATLPEKGELAVKRRKFLLKKIADHQKLYNKKA